MLLYSVLYKIPYKGGIYLSYYTFTGFAGYVAQHTFAGVHYCTYAIIISHLSSYSSLFSLSLSYSSYRTQGYLTPLALPHLPFAFLSTHR